MEMAHLLIAKKCVWHPDLLWICQRQVIKTTLKRNIVIWNYLIPTHRFSFPIFVYLIQFDFQILIFSTKSRILQNVYHHNAFYKMIIFLILIKFCCPLFDEFNAYDLFSIQNYNMCNGRKMYFTSINKICSLILKKNSQEHG